MQQETAHWHLLLSKESNGYTIRINGTGPLVLALTADDALKIVAKAMGLDKDH